MLELITVLITLCTKGVFCGSRYSAGPNTPAVVRGDTPGWVELDLQGGPVGYAHDAFQAARFLVALENEGPVALFLEPGEVIDAGPTDAEMEEWRREDVRQDMELRGWL